MCDQTFQNTDIQKFTVEILKLTEKLYFKDCNVTETVKFLVAS